MVDIRPDTGILSSLYPSNFFKESRMPRTMGGLIGFILTALISTMVALWIINRLPALQMIIAQRAQQ